ncbi:hypothetical protein CcCBS67573_g02368 [Chytriomyces confervae]|uniref:SAM-dependent MTase RsmB/NOP-type domain-containing protein n=1 Tax=Chytriomyces confervae TaxID=246404 RepID=A0A507FKY6_9FUNG|nr:hypothetical protein CcCBS67573_g02368 [Chytriomyces confervae]
MGKRGGRGGRGRGGGRGGPKNGDQAKDVRGTYAEQPMFNDTFEAYYKAQEILSPEEWATNMETLRSVLPTNFRFAGSKANSAKLLELMKKNYFPSLQDVVIEGEKVPSPEPLPWYPNNFGWQYKATRSAIRSNEGIKKFHEFLMAETECGNVSRQEAVSMIPPLLLGVQPGDYVLDMCAAPGSKTAQLIEAIHSNNEVLPTGLIVANDADYKRAYMLVKQSKRLQSPCLVVTNHEAQFFPYIYYKAKNDESAGEKVLQFDRILCDVPCCGDGTLRKNRMIWKNWHQNDGNSLNKIQLAILIRAIHFLKVGGRVVYSTCTFNPVENEAVVAAALNMCGSAIKLLDVSDHLPNLKRRPGVSSWKVMDPAKNMHDKYETVPEKYQDKKVYPDNFPPENAASLNLDRCLRIIPADQDTGAFFVAVFEKVEPYGGLDEQAAKPATGLKRKAAEEVAEESSTAKRVQLDEQPETSQKKDKNVAWDGKHEEPFVFVPNDHKDITDIVDFYGVKPEFPTDQFVVRSLNPVYKTLYLVSTAVKRLLSAENSSKLKIVNTGVKIMTRVRETATSYTFPYRVVAEGVSTISPYLTDKRVIVCAKEDIKLLLEKEYPMTADMSEMFQKSVAGLATGSFIVRFSPDDDCAGSLHEDIVLPILRSPMSCSLLVAKEERKSLMSRVFGAHFSVQMGLDKDEIAPAKDGAAEDDVSAAPADDE